MRSEDGGKPTVLLFHGWSGSNSNLREWMPALAPRFDVLVPDLPGCAGVGPLTERHTAIAYARWALALLDARGIERVAVGGLCSGASIALALAQAAPDRVRALLLHTPFVRPALIRPLVRLQLGLLGSPLGTLYTPLRRSATLAMLHRRLFANGAMVAAENLARDQADLTRADPRASRELALDLLATDHLPFLRSWSRPLYVLLASEDAFVDAARSASVITQAAPQARVTTFAGGHGWTADFITRQHAAMLQVSAELADALRAP